MNLRSTWIAALGVFFIGSIASFAAWGMDGGLWFVCGGGLTLINFFFAAWVVKFGIKKAQNKAMIIGLLFLKMTTFLALILVILMVVKPALLPFTLGISVVIVGATAAALWEARQLKRAG